MIYSPFLSRPDVIYSVVYLGQFTNYNTDEYWEYAERVLKYPQELNVLD